jgi:capsular exopolysaccharide synthesis family protein
MICSAEEGEGKSTTCANLAVAFALAGKSVAVLDLDLRRPAIGRMFGLTNRAGLLDVLLGRTELDSAVHPVSISGATGQMFVIPAGSAVSNAADILESPAMESVVDTLTHRVDIVLVDTPPMLPVSDALIISKLIDAMVIVIRNGSAKTGPLEAFREVLESCPSSKLGIVTTGKPYADGAAKYGYGYYGPPGGTGAAGQMTAPAAQNGNASSVPVGQLVPDRDPPSDLG